MSQRRFAWLSVAAVGGVALLVRWWAAALVVFPIPEDSAYYVGVARHLLAGQGLVTDALWSYGTTPLVLPRPAFELWGPLPSLVAAGPMALLGPSFGAAQLMSVLAGVAVALLAWRLAADLATERGLPPNRARNLALGTGLAVAVYPLLVLHSTLPDSTMLFAALALGVCLLATRLIRAPAAGSLRDPRLWGLGVLLGLAALTRSEAIWLALVWAILVLRVPTATWSTRLRLLLLPAVVALVLYTPWLVRDVLVFGSPFPGQALSNALWLRPDDLSAWLNQPSWAQFLAAGPGVFWELRLAAFWHNLFDVLLLPAAPVALVGLVALPTFARSRALRPVLLVATLLFASTVLIFPVATQAGTFLHDAALVHVLLAVTALAGLDAVLARLAQLRGWTRPTAWLGPLFALVAGLALTLTLLPSFGASSAALAVQYAALPALLEKAGVPAEAIVISDAPIWLSTSSGHRAIVLPNEDAAAVLDLARHFDAHFLVFNSSNENAFIQHLVHADSDSNCFTQIHFTLPTAPIQAAALADTRIWRITCK